MSELGFSINRAIADEFSRAFVAKADLIAEAATRAFDAAGVAWKLDARANIAAAGFSKKWQNALRNETFPNPKRGKFSMRPAVQIHHNIPYSEIFEKGGAIKGDPMLWLPLPNIAGLRVGRSRISPKALAAKGVQLISVVRGGKPPLLAALVNISAKKAKVGNVKLSISNIVTGAAKQRHQKQIGVAVTAKAGKNPGIFMPLFVGINRVNIRKRFNIAGTTAKAQQSLPGLYDEAMGEVLAKRT